MSKKQLIIIIVLVILLCFVLEWAVNKYYSDSSKKPENRQQFQLMVINRGSCYWSIDFKNSPGKDWEELKEVFQFKNLEWYPKVEHVIMQQFLTEDMDEAIALGERLDTYEKCIAYNDSIKKEYDRMVKEVLSEQKRKKDSLTWVLTGGCDTMMGIKIQVY